MRGNDGSLSQLQEHEERGSVSGFIAKHTYYRKKKLARRKNDIFGPISDSARIENVNLNLKKLVLDNCRNEVGNTAKFLVGDCSLSGEISCQVSRGTSIFSFCFSSFSC